MDYTADNLLIPGKDTAESSVFARLSAEQAGWENLNLVALHLSQGATFELTIDDYEYLAVVLAGVCKIATNRGDFAVVGRRRDVFDGLPHAVYLPRRTELTITALSEHVEIASAWSPTPRDYPMRLITPDDITLNYGGAGRASHQMNWLLPPDSPAHRLMAYEQYIPAGNWADFPPYKPADATEFVSLFKFNRPGGFALARVYTDDRSIEAALSPISNDLVIVPRGYHTLASPPGFATYTLNFAAAYPRAYQPQSDPDYAWVDQVTRGLDDRLPLVDHGMEPLKPRPDLDVPPAEAD